MRIYHQQETGKGAGGAEENRHVGVWGGCQGESDGAGSWRGVGTAKLERAIAPVG